MTIRRSEQDQEESIDRASSDEERPELFSRREHIAISLTNARYTVAQIAKELHLSTDQTLDILKSVEEKKRSFSNIRPRT